MGQTNFPLKGTATLSESHTIRKNFGRDDGQSFWSFVFRDRANLRFLQIVGIGSIVQLVLFKLCYPFPDFMSDSYDYIESAMYHLNVNIWPIGYAKFLAAIHQISYNDTFLVSIQYGLLQLSLLYFFYTINYFWHPSKLTVKILFIAIFFSPVSLYISNYVLSDALFASITVTWFTLLLWLFKSPNRRMLVIQVMLMGIAFVVRYTAIYYPIVAAIVILMISLKPMEKIAWIVAPAVLFFPFIRFTQLQTEKITGKPEFSVFGGWQIANNALYMYGNIQVDSTKLPPETRELDRMVKQFHKWAPPGYINLEDFDGTYFIKHWDAPLKQYMWRHYTKEEDTSAFLAWGKVSPIYNEYGSYLVRHYPLAFARYYLWLNTKNYFVPFLAQMGAYNLEEDSVWRPANYWFHYPTRRVWSISKKLQGVLLFIYPPVFMLLNFYFAGCMLWLLFTRKFRLLDAYLQKTLLLLSGFLIINCGFSIFATPVVMRYEIVPMLLLFAFSLLLLEFTDIKKSEHA